MIAFNPGFISAFRPPPLGDAADLGQVRPMPMPMPLPDPGFALGDARPALPIPPIVTGGEGDDRLELPAGGVAFGRGGNDVFVLSSGGASDTPERLGFIGDFDEGDQLDLSRLGPSAGILGREASAFAWGPDRISIDYDGDGDEDGFLLVSDARRADILPMPIPDSGNEVRILPYEEGAISNLDGHVAVASTVTAETWLG